MIPIIVLAVAAASLGFLIGRPSQPRLKRGYPVKKDQPRLKRGEMSIAGERPMLDLFRRNVNVGVQPDPWLVNEAIVESLHYGDTTTAGFLSEMFCEAPVSQDENPPAESVVVSDSASAEKGDAPAASSPSSEPRSFSSPIKGVPDLDWGSFVESMRVADPSFADEKYVGSFHLNRKRLGQLGIAPEALADNEQAQIEAFTADVMDHFEKHKNKIAPYIALPIKIDGSDHVVSLSGMLGLLKAAGPKNAVEWIQNEESRDRFPYTKQLFLKCNQQF